MEEWVSALQPGPAEELLPALYRCLLCSPEVKELDLSAGLRLDALLSWLELVLPRNRTNRAAGYALHPWVLVALIVSLPRAKYLTRLNLSCSSLCC